MRLIHTCLCLAAASGWGQAPEPAEVVRAREETRRVQALVEAGALPASKLREAQEGLEDAEDGAVLRLTLYGAVAVEELTEEQAEEMVGAAHRRLARHQSKIERARQLVEEGAASRLSLTPLLEEGDRRQRALDLTRSRARLLAAMAAMARAEQALLAQLEAAPAAIPRLAERYDGHGIFKAEHLEAIMLAFREEFGKPLPISAHGATAVHQAMGFDHQDRVDVALDPDRPEGIWLRRYLQSSGIPYYAFRSTLPGRSTAPHIHIGPPSTRIGGG